MLRFSRGNVALLAALVVGLLIAVFLLTQEPKNRNNNSVASSPPTPTAHNAKGIEPGAAVLTLVALNRKGAPISQGSGFILTADGLGGTNYHVIKGAARAIAECCNGRKFDVGLIQGADIKKDLVVFQLFKSGTDLRPTGLPSVDVGSWKSLSVGDKVIVVGSPEGLTNSVSDGILSAVREGQSVHYLQITAPISPGSSGGPVFDSTGKMVGIATFQFEEGQNLNFAVAADHIGPLLDQHIEVPLAEFQPQARRGQGAPTTIQANATGEFTGIVHNISADLSAEFAVVVREDDGVLSGCMMVVQPLFGSGPIAGFVKGSDLAFDVASNIGTIEFTGQKHGGSIRGDYTVARKDGGKEYGTFTLRKRNSNGPRNNFDPTKCPNDVDVNQ